MLALIAGTGDLPGALISALRAIGEPDPLICEMHGFNADLPSDLERVPFRLEQLGSFLGALADRGVTEICMAGAVQRPTIDPTAIDAATVPLVPRVIAAMGLGDDGALRAVIDIFEERGFTVKAAHEIAPGLLPPSGCPTRAGPGEEPTKDAATGERAIAGLGQRDIGQACVVRLETVLAAEDRSGTDAMISRFIDRDPTLPMSSEPLQWLIDLGLSVLMPEDADATARFQDGQGAILCKGPKPGQDRRADLPVIGPGTAQLAAEAQFAGIVIEAGGVMVLDLPQVVSILDLNGMFLWVRERGT